MSFMRLKAIENFLLDILETVVISLSIFIVVYMFAFTPHEVIGQSMDGEANFREGQYILTDKVSYKFKEPTRGDVIVFKYPGNKSLDYIKRVIGLPGESVMIQGGKVYLFNDQNPAGFRLDESSYLSDEIITGGRDFLKEGKKVKIPENNYVVMGDNRSQSADSRSWGFIVRQDIIGKSSIRYWPPNEVGIIDTPDF